MLKLHILRYFLFFCWKVKAIAFHFLWTRIHWSWNCKYPLKWISKLKNIYTLTGKRCLSWYLSFEKGGSFFILLKTAALFGFSPSKKSSSSSSSVLFLWFAYFFPLLLFLTVLFFFCNFIPLNSSSQGVSSPVLYLEVTFRKRAALYFSEIGYWVQEPSSSSFRFLERGSSEYWVKSLFSDIILELSP